MPDNLKIIRLIYYWMIMLLKEKFPQIKGLIFDMDGVLWKDNTPIIDLNNLFSSLSGAGYRFALATNNATKNSSQYIKKLHQLGVDLSPNQIVNSSMATAHYLAQKYPAGGPVFIVGEDGLSSTLAEKKFYHAEDHVLAVVVGLDRYFTYEKLKKASKLIRNGAPFIGTNPDKTLPTPDGFAPGAGSILASVESASGIKPLLMGKPERFMIEMAMAYLETTPQTTMVVGDRLDTDILSGQITGCKTTLVMSGVTGETELANWPTPPDLILANASELIR